MAKVADRWHKARPAEGESRCEHGKVPTSSHGKGLQWQARWRDDTGRQRKENFRRRTDAEARVATAVTDVLRGEYIDTRAGRATFRDIAEAWRAAQPHRPTTAKAVEQHLRRYAYPAFGQRRVAAIRPSEVQAWVTSLTTATGLAPSTARTVLNTVKAVFRSASRDRVIAQSPCDGVKPPPVPRRQVQPLTVEQVAALADAIHPRYRALVMLGACTGLRPGELFGLQLRHVDFLKRAVRVEQQVQQTSGVGVYVCPPKTERSHRTVPLPDTAAEALARHLQQWPATGPESFLFTGAEGGAIARTTFFDLYWRPAVRAIGLPKGTGMHALRHAYASMLIAAGESVKVVSERLGHTNAAMTLNVYSHLFPDSEERTRKAVDAAFSTHRSALPVPRAGV
jgi:integrase